MCGIFGLLNTNDDKNGKELFEKIKYRGPDNSQILEINNLILGFHRLSINDLSENGNQPIYHPNDKNLIVICNGEIYNCNKIAQKYNFHLKSHSDCEVIIHLYNVFGIRKTIKMLDGYFAFCIIDLNKNKLYLGRDFIGVRPLFIALRESRVFGFCSEAKGIYKKFGNYVRPFPPASYMEIQLNTLEYKLEKYFNYNFNQYLSPNCEMINHLFDTAVKKRLMSDRPIGAFLSGGLDSSAVVAILAKYLKEFTCFTVAIESDEDNDDIRHAKMLVEYLNKRYNNNIKLDILKVTYDEIWNVIPDLIYTLETYDTTTIRASVCQYLLSRYISKNYDIKVLFSGEGSDEIFGGYKMFRQAPNPEELKNESEKLVKELYLYDCLRTDRSTARWGLEVRVPFLDTEFVKYIMNIDPKFKMCKDQPEKYIFRKAVEDLMPYEVCWRPKEAFSDSVSSNKVSLKEYLQSKISEIVSQEEMNSVLNNQEASYILYYSYCQLMKQNEPRTLEEFYYKKLYLEMYSGFTCINHYWMPPNHWFGVVLKDPSATVLPCYKDKDKDN